MYQANLSHAVYYVGAAIRCDELFQESGSFIGSTLALFDQEKAQIDRSRYWLREHSSTAETDEMLIGYGDAIIQIAPGTLRYDVRQ